MGIFVAYIVLALPFSISGAFIALAIAHQSMNIYSMIGIILLMGIVKKNSILLVDFTNEQRNKHGDSVTEALLNACPVRLRPILMTSVACIAAAIPPAMGFGPGAETRIPMNRMAHAHDAGIAQAMKEIDEAPAN